MRETAGKPPAAGLYGKGDCGPLPPTRRGSTPSTPRPITVPRKQSFLQRRRRRRKRLAKKSASPEIRWRGGGPSHPPPIGFRGFPYCPVQLSNGPPQAEKWGWRARTCWLTPKWVPLAGTVSDHVKFYAKKKPKLQESPKNSHQEFQLGSSLSTHFPPFLTIFVSHEANNPLTPGRIKMQRRGEGVRQEKAASWPHLSQWGDEARIRDALDLTLETHMGSFPPSRIIDDSCRPLPSGVQLTQSTSQLLLL